MQTRNQLLRSSLTVAALVVVLSGTAQATLTNIGTATYGGNNYNLIWDNDINGKSLVWLDYSNSGNTWQYQTDWTLGLGSSISSFNLKTGYSLIWNDVSWRLPTVVGQSGDNFSEFGHLYYTELGNKGYYSTTGAYQSDYGLKNTGDFDNLQSGFYWFGTECVDYPGTAWLFSAEDGSLYIGPKDNVNALGIAVRSGQVVQEGTPVPEPSTVLLLGAGLIGLAGLRYRRRVR